MSKQLVNVIWHEAASPPHTDGSVVFAGWRQCTPHVIHGFLDAPDSASQTASQSVQPFLHSWRQRIPILYNGMPQSPPQNCAFQWCIWTPRNRPTLFLWPARVHIPNGMSIGSAVFVRLTIATDRQTDHATPSVTVNRIYVRSTATRPKNWAICHSAVCC